MKVCPNCRSEYQSEIMVCPDCRISLREEEESPPTEISPEQFNQPVVLISTIQSPAIAGMVKDILEQNGILCSLRNLHFGSRRNEYALGGIEISVAESKAEEAKQIIEAYIDPKGG